MNQWLKKNSRNINDKTKKLLYSNTLIIAVIIIITAISLLSIYLFFFDNKEIAGWSYEELKATKWTWVVYLWFLIAISSSIFGILGDIFLHRNDKKCFIFYFSYLGIYFLNALILFLWFETIENIIILILVFIAFLNWRRDDNSKTNNNNEIKSLNWKMLLITSLIVVVLGFLGGFLINLILGESFYKDRDPYLDSFILFTFLSGWGLLSKKYLQAYLFFIITTILTLILFTILHAWIYVTVDILYLILYFIGINNWITIYYHS